MGCFLPVDVCTKNGRPVADFLREKHSKMHVPLVEKPTCAAFEEYKDLPEMVPLELLEDDIT